MSKLRVQRADGGEKIAERFFSLPQVKSARSVFIYNSIRSEAPTSYVISKLSEMGKTVLLPRVEGRAMVAVEYKIGVPMSESSFKISEPQGVAFDGIPDVTVTPLLAVTKRGERLGYGGGYYDRYLQDKNTFKIGYCYDFQVIEDVFAEEHDVKLDVVVTDKRIIQTKGR